MKKKKVIVIILALIVAALFVWRIWPHSLREIIDANNEPFDEISVNITEFGVDNSSLQMDVYKVEMSPADGALYDQLLTLVEGTKFRQDMRNLLPWDINSVSSGRRNITHSANLMLTGAGLEGGAGFIEVLKQYGAMLFVYGALMTIIPMFAAYFFAAKVLKLSVFNALGSICGGMTSTPALGTLIRVTKTDDVAGAYAATYPMALILVVLCSQFVGILFF